MTERGMRFDDLCAVYHAKRALEVAWAGEHSILFIGPWTSQAGDLAHLARQLGIEAKAVAPCPCGYYGHPYKECTCSQQQVTKWRREQMGARCQFDIYCEVDECTEDQIVGYLQGKKGEAHEQIRDRVATATAHTDLALDASSLSILKAAIRQVGLSFSQTRRVLGVARTIANLAHRECIETCHLAEAIQYRQRAGW